jgi:hypothetical protein
VSLPAAGDKLNQGLSGLAGGQAVQIEFCLNPKLATP